VFTIQVNLDFFLPSNIQLMMDYDEYFRIGDDTIYCVVRRLSCWREK